MMSFATIRRSLQMKRYVPTSSPVQVVAPCAPRMSRVFSKKHSAVMGVQTVEMQVDCMVLNIGGLYPFLGSQ